MNKLMGIGIGGGLTCLLIATCVERGDSKRTGIESFALKPPPADAPYDAQRDDAGWPLDAGDLYPCCKTSDASAALLDDATAPVDYHDGDCCADPQCYGYTECLGYLDSDSGKVVSEPPVHICRDNGPGVAVCPVVHHEACHVLQCNRMAAECNALPTGEERARCFLTARAPCVTQMEQQCYGWACRLSLDVTMCNRFVTECKQSSPAGDSKPPVDCDRLAEPEPCACAKFVREQDCSTGKCGSQERCVWDPASEGCRCEPKVEAGMPSCCGPVDCACG